jgi:hypothetical protein
MPLRIDAVGALPPSGLNDSTSELAFFIVLAINPRIVCFCHPILSRFRTRWLRSCAEASRPPGRLAALARRSGFLLGWFRSLTAFGRLLSGVVFFPDFPLAGAPLAPCGPPLGFHSGFGAASIGFSGSAML